MDPYTEGNIAFKAFFSFFLKRDNFPARYDHMFLLLFVFSAYQKAHNGRQFRGFSRVQSTKFPYSFFFSICSMFNIGLACVLVMQLCHIYEVNIYTSVDLMILNFYNAYTTKRLEGFCVFR